MKTKITFYDEQGYEIGTKEEDGATCCRDDIISFGCTEDDFELEGNVFIVTRVLYYFNAKERIAEARPYGEL